LAAARFYGSLLNGQIDHESSIYATANVFDHPFNFDHKREENLGVGGRSVISHVRDLTGIGYLKVDIGLEAQLLHKAARNYEPGAGQPADLNFVDDIDSRQVLTFLQGKLGLKNRWSITTGLSLQKLSYQVDRTFNADGPAAKVNSDFSWVAAPRLSIAKSWNMAGADYSAFTSYGRAYSPPSLTEFRTNEGRLNTNLKPKRGNSYEVGIKRNSQLGFNAELNIYFQQLSQSITTFQDENEVQLFRNAGGSNQFGIEAVLARELLTSRFSGSLINSLQLRLAYTYQNGTYRD
jgi:iron complex outermembrane receptor protein